MSEDRTVSSLSVQTEPTKLNYTRGEVLNLSGGVLLVTYSDGNITTVDMTDSAVTASGYDPEKDGAQKITLSYSGKSTEITVYVEVYAWELVGRTLSLRDIIYELQSRNRITNGVEEWG